MIDLGDTKLRALTDKEGCMLTLGSKEIVGRSDGFTLADGWRLIDGAMLGIVVGSGVCWKQ